MSFGKIHIFPPREKKKKNVNPAALARRSKAFFATAYCLFVCFVCIFPFYCFFFVDPSS